ncbi:S8 family serine peptidase [Glycomyces xiaoerkulensis]|uniref:S8 family serine peptidase n=1 Tax=Glycomyces xiaoerkulensis TaxID=2038139 RepID=UPI0018E43FC1|nr:S8 family serine peptidase [Glycomyces xiaoerkulensis]
MALSPSLPAQGSSAVSSWHVPTIGAERAWRTATGAGVTVAVIDSGVDADHPDLAGAVLPGRSYVTEAGRTGPRLLALGADRRRNGDEAVAHADPVGHGTAVAGLIAGRGGGSGSGVAPAAEILPVRVLDDQNRYDDSALVADAVEWAVDQGADVVNLSLGGHYDSPALGSAIEYAAARDVLVVACTGNQALEGAGESVWFPARDPRVLAVTGVDRSLRRWPTAISDDRTDLAAPGVGLWAPAAGGGYKEATGTSFASAVAAGAAALVRSAQPELSADEVKYVLTATAGPEGPGIGAGVVDAAAAVAADLDRLPPQPFELRARQEASAPWPATVGTAAAGLLGAVTLLLRARRRPAAR